MSLRQHTPLIAISPAEGARPLSPIPLQVGRAAGSYDEAWVRDLVFAYPEAVPVHELDPSFGPLVPVCIELDTRKAGFADALFINPLGMPTLIECKLWRNPEARREVVGQILDYARVLHRWTYADLQREAARARKTQGFDLFAHVREHARLPDLDQAAFVDNVTRNLAQGRLLLLVLGDGIREGVEAIADYIQGTTGLHFTFGLVEMQIFDLGHGQRIVQPRVLARTLIVNRSVVAVASPDLIVTDMADAADQDDPKTSELSERERKLQEFWIALLATIQLDDVEQPIPKASRGGNIFFYMPIKSSMWLTCYFSQKEGGIGIFLGSDRTSSVAMEIGRRLEADREAIDKEILVPIVWSTDAGGKVRIAASKRCANPLDAATREEQIQWFRETINSFINVLRPRITTLFDEIASGGQSTSF